MDNILIDEARTPLIISGQADEPSDLYKKFAQIVRTLKESSAKSVDDEEPDGDYVVDLKDRVAFLTDEGVEKIERALGIDQLYHPDNADMIPYLDNSLRAHALYHLDKDYIIQDGEIIIVDEFTGRLMYGRRFSEGLHQAIEAKEGVQVRRENLTMATITFQNFFRMYDKLAGMTGTALTEAEEFEKIYNLDVTAIPTHMPMIRADYEDLIFATEEAKFKAIVEEIKERQATGQPILVGTVAIETSERLSKALKRAGIEHQVLNAKQHEREAEIITQAGTPRQRHDCHQHGGSWCRHSARRQPGRSGARTPAQRRQRHHPGFARRMERAGQADHAGNSAGSPEGARTRAACSCSAPSATKPGVSTTSFAVVPVVRATPANRASSSAWKTT